MKRFRLYALGMVFGVVMLFSAHGQTPVHPHDVVVREGNDPVVEVHREPHHRQVFQRGSMRILDLQIPPGDQSWFHTHDWPVFYLTLSASPSRLQNYGEEWAGGRAADQAGRGESSGTAPPPPSGPRISSTTSYIDEPLTHRLENIGDRLFRAMVVVNETEGDGETSVEEAGFAGAPRLENRWFRAYGFTLAPGETSNGHRHHTPAVVFQASPGRGLGSGAVTYEFNDPGQWAYFEAGDVHEITNVGDGPMEFIEVEVRQR